MREIKGTNCHILFGIVRVSHVKTMPKEKTPKQDPADYNGTRTCSMQRSADAS